MGTQATSSADFQSYHKVKLDQEESCYSWALKSSSYLKSDREAFLFKFCFNSLDVSYNDFEKKFETTNQAFYCRKILALPKIVWSGVVLSIYHTSLAILKLPSNDALSMFSKVKEDFREAYGWTRTLFNDTLGQFYVQKSHFNQEFCDSLLKEKEVYGQQSFAEKKNELNKLLINRELTIEKLDKMYSDLKAAGSTDKKLFDIFNKFYFVLGSCDKLKEQVVHLFEIKNTNGCFLDDNYRDGYFFYLSEAFRYFHKTGDITNLDIVKNLCVLTTLAFDQDRLLTGGYDGEIVKGLNNPSHIGNVLFTETAMEIFHRIGSDDDCVASGSAFRRRIRNKMSRMGIYHGFLRDIFVALEKNARNIKEKHAGSLGQCRLSKSDARNILNIDETATKQEIENAFKKRSAPYNEENLVQKSKEDDYKFLVRKVRAARTLNIYAQAKQTLLKN